MFKTCKDAHSFAGARLFVAGTVTVTVVAKTLLYFTKNETQVTEDKFPAAVVEAAKAWAVAFRSRPRLRKETVALVGPNAEAVGLDKWSNYEAEDKQSRGNNSVELLVRGDHDNGNGKASSCERSKPKAQQKQNKSKPKANQKQNKSKTKAKTNQKQNKSKNKPKANQKQKQTKTLLLRMRVHLV